MGHVYQKVVLAGKRSKTVRMFVDTGATFSAIPQALADRLGIEPRRKRFAAKLGDGRVVKMKVGFAGFKINGREAPNIVLIGPVEEPILGVEALEALGMSVDPSSGSLKPTRAYAVRLGWITAALGSLSQVGDRSRPY